MAKSGDGSPKKFMQAETRRIRSRALERIAYDPCTGLATWKTGNGVCVKVGDAAGGRPCRDGYIRVKLDAKTHLLHRLIWLMVHEAWPEAYIDHRNGIRHDNRLVNLREATKQQNNFNQAFYERRRFAGVRPFTPGVSWIVRIQKKYVGIYWSKAEALEAYDRAAREKYGEFARSK